MAAWEHEARGPGGKWVTMYHGTSKEHADAISRNGLNVSEGHIFPAQWPITTANRQTADAYASRGPGARATVEMHIPADKMDEYLWPAQDHIGGQAYALKKRIPAGWVTAVHPVPKFVDYPADVELAIGHHVAGTPYTYYHGWVLRGAAAQVGAQVTHPGFGKGVVRARHGSRADVVFAKGIRAQFSTEINTSGDPVDLEDGLVKRENTPSLNPDPDIGDWPANLSTDDGSYAAVSDYLDPDGNKKINSALRHGHLPDAPAETGNSGMLNYGPPNLHDDVTNMDQVIGRYTTTAPVSLYRGMSLTRGLARKLKPGAVFQDNGFTSTSSSLDWAQKFAQMRSGGLGDGIAKAQVYKGKPVVMRINVPAGTHMAPGETDIGEYVLPRGGRYKVEGIDPDGTYELSMVPS
jgi:hypothetical protein